MKLYPRFLLEERNTENPSNNKVLKLVRHMTGIASHKIKNKHQKINRDEKIH